MSILDHNLYIDNVLFVIRLYSKNSSLMWIFETHAGYGLENCISKANGNYSLDGIIF